MLQRRVGVDRGRDRDVREVVALRDHLGPQEDRGPGSRELGEQPPHGPAAGRARAVHAHQAGRGDEPGQRRLEPLGPRALSREAGRAARRAHPGHRRGVAAVVADEAARRLVVDEGDVAPGAAGDPAAVAAEGHQGEPAPAGQQHGLLAAAGGRVQRGGERPRHRAGALQAHVHHLDPRRGRAVRAGPQRAPRKRPPGLGAGGRGAVDDGRPGGAGPPGGDLARVVARGGVLLVRGVVLLVDHHEPEPGDGREDRAAGPEHDVGLSLAHAPVLLGALGPRHGRVPHAHPLAQARPQSGQELGREGDLGHEHDRAAPGRPRLGDRAQVHLRLARAGDAVQQERPALAQRADDRLEGLRLVGGERRGLVARGRVAAHRLQGARGRRAGLEGDHAVGGHAAQRRHGRPGRPAQLGRGHRAPGLGQGVGHGPPPGAPGRSRAPRASAAVRRGAAPAGGVARAHSPSRAAPQGAVGAGRQHQLQAGRRGRQVVAGGPERELQELGRHRRRVHDARERRQAALVGRRAPADDHPQHASAAQRARHQRPGDGGAVERPAGRRSRGSGRVPGPRPAGGPGPRRPAPRPPAAAPRRRGRSRPSPSP